MEAIDLELLQDFQIEADEIIQEAEYSLLQIEKNEDYQENINNLFRNLHSLKGAAGMFGLTDIEKTAHHLENLLEKFRNGTSIDKNTSDYVLNGLDKIKGAISDGSPLEFELIDPAAFKKGEYCPLNFPEKKAEIKKNIDEFQKNHNEKGLVFLIDDEPDILEVLTDSLEDYGFSVKSYVRPDNFFEDVKKYRPDVIITDYKMPQMNGFDIINFCKKLDPVVPVILLSGFLGKKECIDALANGFYAILEKPYEDHQLIATTLHAIRKFKAQRLLNKSINFILYQFADLDEYLQKSGKEHLRKTLKEELQQILEQKKKLKELSNE